VGFNSAIQEAAGYACATVIDVTRTAHEMAVKTKGATKENGGAPASEC
jgi:hypothetical protein